jgi:MFS family permease
VTRMLFLTMCVAFLLIHMDDGILSLASEHIIRDLKFAEGDLGLIEAAVYLGIIVGCLVCPLLFTHLSPKLLVILDVFSISCCVSAWVFFDSFWILAFARFMNGIFNVSNILKT